MHHHVTAMPGYGLAGDSGLSDDILAKAAAAGDSTAFGVLYQRHAGRVGDHVARWVPPSQREDYVQEIFAQALADITAGRYRPTWTPEGFGEWLTGRVTDTVRRADTRAYWNDFKAGHAYANEARAEILDDVRGACVAPLPPASVADSIREHLAAEADADAVRTALLSALDALEPDCRRVLELRYLEGLDTAATAAAMGRDRESVKWLREKAVGQLRAADLAPLARPGRRREHRTGRTAGTGCVFQLKPDSGPSDAMEEAARELESRIAAGEFGAPGAQLPPGRQLVDMLGTSRMSVQRIMHCLAERGVIYSLPRRGYFISDGTGPAADALDEPESTTGRDRGWGGYVHVPDDTGTVRRRWVYGRTPDDVRAKLDDVLSTADLAEAA